MTLKEIYQFFQNPQAVYLNQELATCFILDTLLRRDSYGSELVQLVEHNYSPYRLSDTVLYSAIKFLVDEGVISRYSQKVEGRGRPRQMYQIRSEMKPQAEELSHLWKRYINGRLAAIA